MRMAAVCLLSMQHKARRVKRGRSSMETPSRFVRSRRGLLLGSAGLVGGALLPEMRIAVAQEKPPLGTWPAGSSGSSVFVGISCPRTGTYAVPGEDELKGAELALEHINSGNDLIRKIAPGVTKGLLGK